MDALTTTMTIPSALQSSDDNHDQSQSGGSIQSVSVLAVVPTLSQLPSEAGATVYVAGSTTPKGDSTIIWSTTSPKVQLANDRSLNSSIDQSTSSSSSSPDAQTLQQQQQPAHVVKIKINPALDNSRVISTVRLAPDQIDPRDNNPEFDECYANKKENIERVCATSIVNSNLNNVDSCVRISLMNNSDYPLIDKQKQQREDMIQPGLSECVNNNTTTNSSSTCFYYGPFPNSISTMSSGQCSPSDTLDSGTCSDLDSTPPPLPKKKNASTVILDITNTSGKHNRTGSLTSSGAEIDSDDNESNISCDSLNSGELAGRITEQTLLTSGVDVSSEKSRDLLGNEINMMMIKEKSNEITMRNLVENVDEHERINLSSNKNNNVNGNDINNSNDYNDVNDVNENSSEKLSSFMADAISSGQNSLTVSPSPSGTSSFSKSSSTPRVGSPNPLVNGRCLQSTSPVVKESTYEDRKKEQKRMEQENATAEHFANYNRNNGTKYVYEDDRFYKFHINELEPDNDDENNKNNDNNNIDKNKKFDGNDTDEYFAGYKILDKEAIRSAKGTVRGVKNRVRAGIATFLQNPSSKNYKQKDAGKVVVYTTSMRVVTKTMIACMKMRQILNTHMVQYEERDLFGSREYQAELKERLDVELVDVPQLFIDGQHIGDADAVERLNESEELRPMLKPYKYRGVRKVCPVCGGANAIPCISCHGSKKSWRWNGFLNEVFALRCMNCDEVGLIRCPSC